ncbi:MAG TPA: hypothetical protein VMR62_02760 [Bryobacteraceae bacterium]|jgi:hypothetical protein|nr:hypothetical protein [Bryobacteraceae bacterium]
MKRSAGAAVVCHCLCFQFAAETHAQNRKPTFTTIEVPGAGTSANGQGTYATSINSAGVVTGYYVDADNAPHGFVLPAAL